MTFFCGPTAHNFLFANENKLVGAWWPKSFDKIFLSEGTSALNSLATSSASLQVEESKRARNLISGFLKLDAIQKYIPVIDTVAKHHIENEWAPKGDNVVVIDMAKKFTFELACQLLLNVTDSKQVRLRC
ncbi:Cytochrome P450 716A1 [Camellia lanceoleosa]|uniref:Cytochrome P450 716A1 n=1 Tax=Camellia lanceoleosa TaxID=1840588 RepID=A0ACC0FGG3_9ERIC|nr:Cytochrome P450 716A1 [Camellia lanceoleosa]